MFERYTERARRVIFFARYEASVLGGSMIDTEHVLLGLLREGSGVTGKILRRGELTYKGVLKQVEARGSPGERTSTSVDMPLSAGAKRALQDASSEAERMNAPHIGTEHVLLGLLGQPDCLAAGILNSSGLRLADVREEARLRPQAKETSLRPDDAFPKLTGFLQRLEDRRAAYHVSPFREEAIRVEVGFPDEKWVATFFPDGQVTVEAFSVSGGVEGESALARLIERLGPPQQNDR